MNKCLISIFTFFTFSSCSLFEKNIDVYHSQWTETFGGSSIDIIYDITMSSDSSLLFAGISASHDDGISAGNKTGYNFWIVKTTQNGEKLWEKSYGGKKNDLLMSCIDGSDGGYILCGMTDSNDQDFRKMNKGKRDGVIVKIESNERTSLRQSYGGSENDYLYQIIKNNSGKYMLCGASESKDGDLSTNKGGTDGWFFELDDYGKILWSKTYGGDSSDVFKKIYPLSDGYLLGGYTKSSDGDITSGNHGGDDYWLVKVDLQGKLIWEKTYGGKSDDILYDIQVTADNHIILVGNTKSNEGDIKSGNHGGSDIWVVWTDKDGNLLNEQTYGGSGDDYVRSSVITKNNTLIMAGYTNSTDGDITTSNSGENDGWVLEININDGSIIKSQTYGGSGNDLFNKIYAFNGNKYILGGCTTSSDGDITTGNKGSDDFYLKRIIWK